MSTDTQSRQSGAEKLRVEFIATQVNFTWFGTRRSVSESAQTRMAEPVGADPSMVRSRKQILDTKHPAWRRLTSVKGAIGSFWRGIGLPYTEPGIRLIRNSSLDQFESQMQDFRFQLAEALAAVQAEYSFLREEAKKRLGELFDENDYPESLEGKFGVEWQIVSIAPPDYLMDLRPDLYEREVARMRAQLEETARRAEDAFAEELAGLVGHLAEVLSDPDKKFQASTVENLTTFFDRFENLSVSDDQGLGQYVQQARDILGGVNARGLRKEANLRKQVAQQMVEIKGRLDCLLEDKPRRAVIRRK